jgi:putative MATE family efflux protein
MGPIPALGVAGAAIATALSNLVGTVVILILLNRMKEYVSLSPRGFRFDWGVVRDILRLGIPASATMVIVSLSSMVFIRLINDYGTSAAAAYGIGIRLEALIMMPAQSIGMAMSTIAGQNIGAGKKERIYKSLRDSQIISGGLGVIIAVVLVMIPGLITRVFQPKPEDYSAVLPFIVLYVHIVSLRYIAVALYFPIIGTIRGAGDVIASLVISGSTQLAITIPAAIVLAIYLGYAGVLWALTLSMFVALIIAYAYYRTGRWENRAIITSGESPQSVEIPDGL